MFCVMEDALAPEVVDDLLAGDELAGALDQEGQQLERDALKADWLTAATKLVGELVELEVLKSKEDRGHG